MSAFTQLFSIRSRHYRDPLERSKARGIQIVANMSIVLSLVWVVMAILAPDALAGGFIAPTVAFGLSVVLLLTLQRGSVDAAAYLVVALTTVAVAVAVLFGAGQIELLVVLIPMVLAGMLLERAGVILTGVTLIMVVLLDVITSLNLTNTDVLTVVISSLASMSVIGMATLIQVVFVGQQKLIAKAALEDTENLKRVLQVNENIDAGMKADDVHSQMIRVLRSLYQLDSVQVYLLDDTERLSRVVRAGMREAEVVFLAESDVLTLGDTHPVSDAARLQSLVEVTRESLPKRRAYLIAGMEQALAIPIVDGGRVLGVVDIQSSERNAFSAAEVEMLRLVVGNYATLLHVLLNTDVLRQTMREKDASISRMEQQLANLQRQRQQLVSGAWSEYVEKQGAGAVGFDIESNEIVRAADMPPAMRDALTSGEKVYITATEGRKTMSVPILLRDEVLGAMSFKLPIDRTVTERQIELANTIALRLGSALENTRLLEQTQQQANRERKATEVGNLLFGATDVDSLLRIAADSFNDTLGAIQTRIYIEPGSLSEPGRATPPPDTGASGGVSNGNGNRHRKNGGSA